MENRKLRRLKLGRKKSENYSSISKPVTPQKPKIYFRLREIITTAKRLKDSGQYPNITHKRPVKQIFPLLRPKKCVEDELPKLKDSDKSKIVLLSNVIKKCFSDEDLKVVDYSAQKKTETKPRYMMWENCEITFNQKLKYTTSLIADCSHQTPLINDLRSDFIITQYKTKRVRRKEQMIKAQKAMRTQEEVAEMKDYCGNFDMQDMFIKTNVKKFLGSKGNKLNQIILKHDKFFSSLENRVNFLFDNYTLPYFHSNLLNFSKTENKADCLCKYQNFIEPEIQKYLGRLRLKIQREKDESEYRRLHPNKEEEIEKEIKASEKKTILNPKAIDEKEKKRMLNYMSYKIFLFINIFVMMIYILQMKPQKQLYTTFLIRVLTKRCDKLCN